MFNWVCPQCGKDVPPSKTECPYCAERAKEAAAYGYAPPGQPQPQYPPQQPQYQPPPPPAPPQQSWQPPAPVGWQPQPPPPPPAWQPPVAAPPPPAPPPPPPPQAWQPPQQPPPPQQYAPHPQAPAPWPPQPARSGLPTWVMGMLFAVGFIVIGAGVIYWMGHSTRTNTAEKAGLENPANPSQQKVTNPMQKFVEVVGIRMLSENKKPVAKFVVVNHSNSEISGLEANVTLWASTSRSEEDSVGSFSFKLASLGSGASKDLTEPLKTKLKPYEMPDWQNVTAELQITSPAP